MNKMGRVNWFKFCTDLRNDCKKYSLILLAGAVFLDRILEILPEFENKSINEPMDTNLNS